MKSISPTDLARSPADVPDAVERDGETIDQSAFASLPGVSVRTP